MCSAEKWNYIWAWRLAAVSMLISLTALCFAQFGGGSGTTEDPWQIATAEHLSNIRDVPVGHFLQTADIDLGVAPWNEGEGWLPILRLNRTYNGNGFRIKNLTINRPETSQVGLFSEFSGSISNLGLIAVNIIGGNNVGGITGRAYDGSFNGCYVTGIINGKENIGGIVGSMMGSRILNSYSTAHIHSRSYDRGYVGGLVGKDDSMAGDVIVNCYATGPVTSDGFIIFRGALMGYSTSVEEFDEPVINSWWNLDTVGLDDSPGGGEGRTTTEMQQQESFTEWDFDDVWDIIEGETYPFLQMQGEAHQQNYPLLPPTNVRAYLDEEGSIVLDWEEPSLGEPERYKIYRNFIYLDDIDSAIFRYVDNEVEDFTSYRYFISALYNERESPITGTYAVTPVPGGYDGGKGTEEIPYRIASVNQLDNIRHNLYANYIQTADIDLSVIDNWQPIGKRVAEVFTGSYNGNGHIIRNLTINLPDVDYVGFFGYLPHKNSTIKRIVLEDVNIAGNRYVGGLAGEISEAVVDSCRVSGAVIGSAIVGGLIGKNSWGRIQNSHTEVVMETGTGNYIGGLVGYNYYADIDDSWSISTVQGQNAIGGLIGFMYGNVVDGEAYGVVNNCYAIGSVQGDGYTGGFVGWNDIAKITNSYARVNVNGTNQYIAGFAGMNNGGTIINCYSTGRVSVTAGAEDSGGFIGYHDSAWGIGRVVNSYWDTINSGQNFSAAGIGRTTAEMTYPYNQNTYLNWDFDNLWKEDTGGIVNNGYPYLWYQLEPDYNLQTATNPTPEDGAENVSVNLRVLYWDYYPEPIFVYPLGFRVYLNKTGEFVEDEPFVWVPFTENVITYSCRNIIQEDLEYNSTYYWKVVPTTNEPESWGEYHSPARKRSERDGRMIFAPTRGDAEDVPVWSFTTINTTDVEAINVLPVLTKLNRNYPNPFNPETTISFSLAETSDVVIEIFNNRGQKVVTLADKNYNAGNHQVIWNGRDSNGNPVGSGIYLYRMKTNDYKKVNKAILLK